MSSDSFGSWLSDNDKDDYAKITERALYEKWRLKRDKMAQYEEMQKLMERMKQEQQNDPRNYCRICGQYLAKTSNLFSMQLDKLQLCENCHSNIIKNTVDNMQRNNPSACPKCLSHLNACICPERKAFKKLKK